MVNRTATVPTNLTSFAAVFAGREVAAKLRLSMAMIALTASAAFAQPAHSDDPAASLSLVGEGQIQPCPPKVQESLPQTYESMSLEGVPVPMASGPAAVPDPACPSVPEVVRPLPPDIFGRAAVPVGQRSMQAKWERARSDGLPGKGHWDEVLEQLGSLAELNRLEMVNHWVNWHVRFQDDAEGGDEWSGAGTTLARGAGDCEDLAIAKMALLERAGFSPRDMFLIVVRERTRPIDHAVLAVRQGEIMYVLDSRTDRVQPAESISDYLPASSYTDAFAWIYGYATQGRGRP